MGPDRMPNLRGLVAGAQSLVPVPWLSGVLVVLLSAAAVAFAVMNWPHRNRTAEPDLGFALALTSSVLASYHLYLHDLSLMVLPLLVLVSRRGLEARDWATWAVAALFCTPLYLLLLGWQGTNLLCLPTIGVLVALGWCAKRAAASPPRDERALL
jgi:hypothetical protein